MIDLTDCILIGTIIKPHGIHGEVILQLDQLSVDDIQKLESVFIEIDGLPVPFFISRFEKKNSNTFIIAFDDIDIKAIVNDIIDCPVFIEASTIPSSKKRSGIDKTVIGYSVTDEISGYIGKVKEILDSEYNPLLKILHSGKEILLPLQSEFILQIDHNKKNIYVNVPEGLLDLTR